MRRPIVIVPACAAPSGGHARHSVHAKYIDAVVLGARCMPLILPALAEHTDLEAVLATAEGVMLTGSVTNVHAGLYGQPLRDAGLPLDPARDATTLPLIRAVVKRGIPLLAICRGLQEINVALGGTLHQAVHDVPGMLDHRDRPDDPPEVQYGPAHPVTPVAGGRFAALLGSADPVMVNSLHGQGIAKLAPGLTAEALAADGLVEACSIDGAAFALAVQWHPEWQAESNPVSLKLFRAFGDACRAYRQHGQQRGARP